MDNFIDHIYIRNFKSIRECDVEGCKRINLFIGRPNVGKSNILEALSVFSIPFLKENSPKKLSSLVRLENDAELFYQGDTGRPSIIRTNIGECELAYLRAEGLSADIVFYDHRNIYPGPLTSGVNMGKVNRYQISDTLAVKGFQGNGTGSPIKRYTYKHDVRYKRGHAKYLVPPFGINLLSVLLNYKELKHDVERLFRDSGLNIAFDKASHTIKVIQKTKDGIFLIPYNSIADTLQRIIFYKAAIASNTNSVLLFEEPEAHAFPPYMTHLTQEMIYKRDNQYFIATHSPFILNDLLENSRDELAVFMVHYEEGETRVRLLTKDEMHQTYQNGIDLFTNSESFI